MRSYLRRRLARTWKVPRVPRGYHGPQYSEDIASLLRERVSVPPVLFGHSLGGMLAMRVASDHPELVRALILGDNMIVTGQLRNPMYTSLFAGLRDLARRGGSVEKIADGIGKIALPLPGGESYMDGDSNKNKNETITIRQLPGNDEAYLLSWARCVLKTDPDTYDMTLDGSSLQGMGRREVAARNHLPNAASARHTGIRRPDVRRGCNARHTLADPSRPCEVP